MREMKKIFLAAVLGVLVGIGAFFSPITVSQPANTVLQSGAVPEAYMRNAASQPTNLGTWSVGIGLLLGAIVGLGTFLFAKRRSRLT
jgi:hypothetical protein